MFGKLDFLSKSRLPVTRPESVYFYTLQRCASSLFRDYVLKNVSGLRLIDYHESTLQWRPDRVREPLRRRVLSTVRCAYQPGLNR